MRRAENGEPCAELPSTRAHTDTDTQHGLKLRSPLVGRSLELELHPRGYRKLWTPSTTSLRGPKSSGVSPDRNSAMKSACSQNLSEGLRRLPKRPLLLEAVALTCSDLRARPLRRVPGASPEGYQV